MSARDSSPDWLTPHQLFQVLLDTSRLPNGETVSEFVARLRRWGAQCREEQQLFGGPEEVYRQKRRDCEQGERDILADMEAELRRLGTVGLWIGYGRTAPDARAEIIPPRYWHFLDLDLERATAVSETDGLRYAGVRMLMAEDLPPKWRARIKRDLAAALTTDRPHQVGGKADAAEPPPARRDVSDSDLHACLSQRVAELLPGSEELAQLRLWKHAQSQFPTNNVARDRVVKWIHKNVPQEKKYSRGRKPSGDLRKKH